jgi:hypothetical protein
MIVSPAASTSELNVAFNRFIVTFDTPAARD